MEHIHVVEIAMPGKPLAIAEELQSGEINNRTGGAMFAGNPLGINQREVTGKSRNLKLGMKNLLRRMGRVHQQMGDRNRSGSVGRLARFTLAKGGNGTQNKDTDGSAL